MRDWFDTVSRLGLKWGTSFDLDFHTIPFHGDDALVEKHYVSKRSRRQKGMLAFLAQDADTRVFCYANGELRKDRAERRDPPLRRVLEATDRPAARGTDLRLQADDLRQPQQAEPDGDPVHHAAATVQEAPRRDRADTGVGLATDRTGERLPGVQDAARPGPADHPERLRRPAPAVDHRRAGARGTDLAADQPVDPIARPT